LPGNRTFVRTADVELPPDDQITLTYSSRNPRAVALLGRMEEHRVARHWHRVQPAQSPPPGVLLLTDEEAQIAGIDRLPLVAVEPPLVIHPPTNPIIPALVIGPRRI
jgi:hypothetical protein